MPIIIAKPSLLPTMRVFDSFDDNDAAGAVNWGSPDFHTPDVDTVGTGWKGNGAADPNASNAFRAAVSDPLSEFTYVGHLRSSPEDIALIDSGITGALRIEVLVGFAQVGVGTATAFSNGVIVRAQNYVDGTVSRTQVHQLVYTRDVGGTTTTMQWKRIGTTAGVADATGSAVAAAVSISGARQKLIVTDNGAGLLSAWFENDSGQVATMADSTNAGTSVVGMVTLNSRSGSDNHVKDFKVLVD